jgi:hypothetical protein
MRGLFMLWPRVANTLRSFGQQYRDSQFAIFSPNKASNRTERKRPDDHFLQI